MKTNLFKKLFWITFSLVLLIYPILSRDFGTTFDERVHNGHGKMLLDYFRGESTLAAQSPFTPEGALKPIPEDEYRKDLSDLNFFGGTFDLIVAFTQRYLPFTGDIEQRHFVNSLFGVLAILFVGLIAYRVAGWRAGFLALLMMALCPRFMGHSMNNPKDVPFAALYIASVFFMLRFIQEIPKPRIGTLVALAVTIAISISIRVAGILLIPLLFLFVLLAHAKVLFDQEIESFDFKGLFKDIGLSALVGIAGYLLPALLWPFDRSNPLTVPLHVLSEVSKLAIFNSYDLFEGRHWYPEEIPWYYMPKWTLIGTPLFILCGLMTSALLLVRTRVSGEGINKFALFILLVVSLLPILFVIVNHSYIFHDGRHLLFTLPPFVVICALSWENLLRMGLPRWARIAIVGLLLLFTLEPVVWIARNHPNQTAYFSPIIGGVDGAWKKYETDYYGNSIRQGIEWIQANDKPSKGKKIRIRLPYGMLSCADYWIAKKSGYELVWADEYGQDWDYTLLMTSADKTDTTILATWPPLGTVYEVKAGSTPLLAVYKNLRLGDEKALVNEIQRRASGDQNPRLYFRLGVLHFSAMRYAEAIGAFQEAVRLDSNYVDAWNNMGDCKNITGDYKGAIAAFGKVLQLAPNYELAINNMNDAMQKYQLANGRDPNFSVEEENRLIDLSLQAYQKQDFVLAANYCKEVTKHNPANAVAWNNLGAAYNALQQYDEALVAIRKALEINPNFDLAINNLRDVEAKRKR